MKFGVREICEVVLKAKADQMVGNKKFYKGEPVIYFDTLKTSGLEGAATTVYATGGRGNARLMAWEGERTVTFTMEDALISPAGFMILTGAGLVEPTEGKPIQVHVTETTDLVDYAEDGVTITLEKEPSTVPGALVYVMLMNGDDVVTEPYLAEVIGNKQVKIYNHDYTAIDGAAVTGYAPEILAEFKNGVVLVDYYTDRTSGVQQIEITPDKFGGNYYLEASTLFRDTNGRDMPAEFIIPNCKVQSNFNFTMASTGDPSTFTFTMDAFPDYTRFDRTKKVIAAIQVVTEEEDDQEDYRIATPHTKAGE